MITDPVYGLPNPVTCVTGRATTSSAKILVASLTSAPVTVTVNGINYVSGVDFTLTGRGSPVVVYTGLLEVTGLTEFTRYSWSATNGTDSDSGSFLVEPTSGQEFQFEFCGCDNNTTFIHASVGNTWRIPGQWQNIKTQAVAATPPMAGVAFVDDLGYVSRLSVDDTANSGLAMTGAPNANASYQTLNNYLIGWCALLGMLGPNRTSFTAEELAETANNSILQVLWAREENRSWCRKNLNMWTQWGDWEFKSDMGWDAQPTGDAWTNGKAAWECFYGLIKPDLDGITPRDVSAKHWCFKIGDVVIASLDGVTNASRTWGSNAVPNGISTSNSAGLTQFTTIYGNNQIDDVLESIATLAGRATVLCLAHGIRYLVARTGSTPPHAFTALVDEYSTGTQHPIYDHCLADYQRIFTRTGATPASLMDSVVTNGNSGTLLVVMGDWHHGMVYKFQHAAYTGNAAENFYGVCLGGTNGSAYLSNLSAYTTGDTVASIYIESDASSNDTNPGFHGLTIKRDGVWLTVNHTQSDIYNEYDNTVLWNKKFMPKSANFAFESEWEIPNCGMSSS